VDLSARVIEVAGKLKENRKFEYDCKLEGEVTTRLAAAVDEGIDTSRCTFVTVRGHSLACVRDVGSFSSPGGLHLCPLVVCSAAVCVCVCMCRREHA
jgi:hypothetical protein